MQIWHIIHLCFIVTKEYVVTAGTQLEMIQEEEDVVVSRKSDLKKKPRLIVFPTDPGERVVSKRKQRKEMVKKKGLKLVKGCGAILDKKGKVDGKKVDALVEAMERVLWALMLISTYRLSFSHPGVF